MALQRCIIPGLCGHSRGSISVSRRALVTILNTHQKTPQHFPLHVSDWKQRSVHSVCGSKYYAGKIFEFILIFILKHCYCLDHRDTFCSWMELPDLHCHTSLASHPHLQHQESQVPLSLLSHRQHP